MKDLSGRSPAHLFHRTSDNRDFLFAAHFTHFYCSLQPNCPSRRSCALWNDQCLSETLRRFLWEQSPSHSVPLLHGREKLRAINHTLGFINLIWWIRWDIMATPLAMWTAVPPAWHHCPPRGHTGGSPLSATCCFTMMLIDPLGSQFSYLNITSIDDACWLSHRDGC